MKFNGALLSAFSAAALFCSAALADQLPPVGHQVPGYYTPVVTMPVTSKSGQKAGQAAGQKAGQAAGQKAGQAAGQKAGQAAGQKAGQKAPMMSKTST